MKKIALVLLAFSLLLTFVACAENNGNEQDTSATGTNEQITIPDGTATESTTVYEDVTVPEEVTTAKEIIDIPADQLTFTETDDEVRVVSEAANIRSDTSMKDGAVYAQAKKNTVLKRTGYCGDWYRVIYEEKVCYVRASVVVLIEAETTFEEHKTMYVTASSLTVRSTSDFSSTDNAIGYVYKGDAVEVVASGDGWCRIIFSNQWYDKVEAYVGARFLSETAPETTAEEATTVAAQ